MATQSPLVNIVDSIDEEIQQEIANTIIADYENDWDSYSEHRVKIDKWYKLWACYREPKNDPWPGASNVCVPFMATAANQLHARAYQSIFAAPGMVKVLPVGALDRARAGKVEHFMNWQLLYDMEEYEEVWDRTLLQLPLMGTVFKKVRYDKDLERPVSEYLGPTEVVIPYKTRDLASARRITQRMFLHYEQLQERDDAGLYSNFDKISEKGTEDDDDQLKQTADDIQGVASIRDDDEPHLILECHRMWEDLEAKEGEGKKRVPYIFWVHRDSGVLLRAVKRTFSPTKGSEVTLNFFVDYHLIPNPEGFYSFGFGHFLEPLNEMANTAFNQIFDAGRLTNQPFGFYGRRAGLKARKIKLHPGLMNEVEDPSQVVFPSMQRLDNVLFSILGLIQQYTEQFSSATELMTGRQQRGVKTPTASGTLAVIEQGLITFAVITKRITRSLRKELRLIFSLNQLFLPETKQFRVSEDMDQAAFPEIKRNDFDGKFDVIPLADPTFASRQQRVEEASQVYGFLMQNPLVVGNPNMQLPPNIRGIYNATKQLLEDFGKRDISRFLPDIGEESLSPAMENAMFMQGDYKKPVSGEDHIAHLQAHDDFSTTDVFAKMPSDYKELVERHITETLSIQEQDHARAVQQAMIQQQAMQENMAAGNIEMPEVGGEGGEAGAEPMPESQGFPVEMMGGMEGGSVL